MTIYFIEQRTIKHIKGCGSFFSFRKNLSHKHEKKLLYIATLIGIDAIKNAPKKWSLKSHEQQRTDRK